MFKQSILSLYLCSFVVTATPQQSLKTSTPFTQTWYGSFLIQNLTSPIVDAVVQRVTGHTPTNYFYSRLINTQPRFIFENKSIKKGLETIRTQLEKLEEKLQPYMKQTIDNSFEVLLGKKNVALKKEIVEIKEKIESEQEKLENEFYQFYRSKRWLMLKMNAFQLTQSYASTLAMNFALQLGSRESTPFSRQLAQALIAQTFPVIMSALSTAFGANYRSPVALLSAQSNYVMKLFTKYENKKEQPRTLNSLKITLASAYNVKPPSVPFFPNPFTTTKHVYITDETEEQKESAYDYSPTLFQYRFNILPPKAQGAE